MPTEVGCFCNKSTQMVPESNSDYNDTAIVWMISIINITLVLMSGVVFGQLDKLYVKKLSFQGFTCYTLVSQL